MALYSVVAPKPEIVVRRFNFPIRLSQNGCMYKRFSVPIMVHFEDVLKQNVVILKGQ